MSIIQRSFFVFVLSIFIALGNKSAFSQNVTASANQTFFDCGGGPVQLTAVGNTSSTVFGDDFNSGILTAGWSTTPSAQFNNPCGASFDGSTYLWMGSSTSAPRTLTTNSVDVSCGGTVCFDFKFTCEFCGDSSPCEGADFYNEGVSLQYSTNGGTSWTDISYFAPNGNLLTNYPGAGASAPIAFGTTNFTTWANYCFPIPAGGFSANTEFRLFQWGASGAAFDHWGIDNFVITATPCTPFVYDWSHIPGSPDAASVTTNITQTTTFTVNYTDGTTTYTDQVTVVVDNLEVDNLTITPASCYGVEDASVSVTMLNGQPPYTFDLSGPTTLSNSTGNFTGLTAGLYTITITDDDGCPVVENFVMPQGPSCCTVSATGVDPTCDGLTNGSIQSTPSGGIPAYTYQWYSFPNILLPGQVFQSIGNIGDGTYIVEITDISGCTSRDTVVLSAPAPLAGTLTVNQMNCFSVCDGSIEMPNLTGGTPPYEYALNNNNYGSNGLFDNLCAGNYTYKVRDANNCLFTATATITQPANLLASVVFNNNEICGQGDGEFQVQATGGVGPYTYTTNGTTNATGLFSNLTGGLYPVVVTDQNGCTVTINVTVVNIPPPNPTIDFQQDVACAGGQNGAVVVAISISTGTAPFTYNLDNTGPVATNTFNVNAGPHIVDVLDANGCGGSVSFTIGQPIALSFTTTNTDATCNGSCDGTITVAVPAGSGTAPYQYSSDNGISFQNSNVLTGLCVGNIDVVVKDANGCFANGNVNIGEPTILTSSNTTVDPTCFNGCDGSISFGVTSGGVGPYEYSIDGGATYQVSQFFTNNCAGTYNLIARDANNCEFEMPNVVLNNPLQIQFNDISETGSNCGFANGGFEVQAINGTGPYNYSLDMSLVPSQLTGNFTGLAAGLYTVYVEDDNGCVDSTSEDVSDIEITTALDSIRNVTCFNGTDGAVFVSVITGLPPFSYTLDSVYFQTVGVFDGAADPFVELEAGPHFVTISDDGACFDFYEFVLTQPDSITYSVSQVNTNCLASNDGQITFTNVLGGDGGPYVYSIDNGVTFFPTNTFTGLAAGTYSTIVQDGNGCQGGLDVNIQEPTNISTSINPTDLTCFGDNSGSIILSASGGAGGYNYNIGPANNPGGIFLNLAAGLYNITITDANGCTIDTTHTLTQPDTLVVGLVTVDNLCFGDCSGEITVSAAGGTLPYLYSANNGVNQQASNILDNLCAGIQTVQVQDFRNCTYTVNQPVISPPDLTLALAVTVTTCGNNNGTITATANGGTAGYTYSISDDNGTTYSIPQASGLFNNLAPNNYIVKVIDGNLCETEASITVNADPLPTIELVETIDILCNGETSGEIDVTSGGGVGAFDYSLDNITFVPGNVFTNLAAGTYDIYVRDGNNCIALTTATIVEPDLLVSNGTGTDLVCNNDFSGQISLVPTGGTANFLYSIDNGATFQPFGFYNNLAANTYNTIVVDANNCTSTMDITLAEPTAITSNPVTTDVSCFGACDGIIDLQASGGTGVLNYQWTGNIALPTSGTAMNVCFGDYNAIITDANGCFVEEFNIAVAQPPQLVINSSTVTNVSCFGLCDGEIVIDAPLAVTYEITINGVTTTNATGIFQGLCEGNYDIAVSDILGCQVFSNTTVTQPDVLVGNPPSDWTNVCFNSQINVSAGFTTGGTLPYVFNWSDALGNMYPATATFSQTVTVDNTYTFDIIDANGCTAGPYSFNMTVTPQLELNPTSNQTPFICPGDDVTMSALAGGGQLIDFGDSLGYSYLWDTGNPLDTLPILTVTPPLTPQTSTYTLTVTDYCNAMVSVPFTVTLHPDPTPTISPLDTIDCVPYNATLENTNNVGGETTWDFSNGLSQTGQIINNVIFAEPGCYDVTVSNFSANGCSGSAVFENVVCVNPLPKANFEFSPLEPRLSDEQITFDNLSVGAENYYWDFGRNGRYEQKTDSLPFFNFADIFFEQTSFTVCLTAETNFGCEDSICKIITVQEDLIFYVPNTFTPGAGNINSFFKPEFTSGFDPYQYELLIFNRWGEIVFQSLNADEGWDGTYGELDAPQAAYVWKISYEDTFENTAKTISGHVTLLR